MLKDGPFPVFTEATIVMMRRPRYWSKNTLSQRFNTGDGDEEDEEEEPVWKAAKDHYRHRYSYMSFLPASFLGYVKVLRERRAKEFLLLRHSHVIRLNAAAAASFSSSMHRQLLKVYTHSQYFTPLLCTHKLPIHSMLSSYPLAVLLVTLVPSKGQEEALVPPWTCSQTGLIDRIKIG